MPVTRFDVALRRPLADGAPFGDVGPYEEIKGRLSFAIDPTHEANRRVTDVERAPRTSDGHVEFSAGVSLLVPAEAARASGRVLLDVVNRGNTVSVPNFNRATRPTFGPDSDPDPPIDVGDGFLMRRGWVVISCGWQLDVPEFPGLHRLQGPDALGPDGAPLRGRVYTQLQPNAPATHLLLSDRGHRPSPAADVDERDAILLVRDQPDGDAQTIPRHRWHFGRVVDGTVVPDPRYVSLDGGFEKGRLYQIVYTAIGAPVLGLGMLALRDAVSWLKHGTADHPMPGRLRFAYAYGRSQTGRLLRTFVYWDLNRDEDGREALDGIIANVAGGMRGEFNQRFGQNSKDRPHMMPHLFPSTDVPTTDRSTGRTDALHARIDARGSRLKVLYTNTSAEYHRGDASLVHTDPDGERDVAHGPHVRVYHFAGTEHGLGAWPPTDVQPAAVDPTAAPERSQNLRGVIDYARVLRACLVNLDRWVTEGVEPPASRHPRLADGTAVPPEKLAGAFDRIPGARYPRHQARPQRLDFGMGGPDMAPHTPQRSEPSRETRDDPRWPDPSTGPEFRTISRLPPRPGPAFGSLVSAVDGDGNELAGIVLPEIAVPLATHTGWNLRHPDIGGETQRLVFAGATLPFARTRAERDAAGDPRPSIAERYASRAEYLDRVRAAALALARERWLLDEDVQLSVALAARMWDRWA
jgi:hypothetical protein